MMEDIDNSNGVMFPFYDADTNMVYLVGRVRYNHLILYLFYDGYEQFSSGWDTIIAIFLYNNLILYFLLGLPKADGYEQFSSIII